MSRASLQGWVTTGDGTVVAGFHVVPRSGECTAYQVLVRAPSRRAAVAVLKDLGYHGRASTVNAAPPEPADVAAALASSTGILWCRWTETSWREGPPE